MSSIQLIIDEFEKKKINHKYSDYVLNLALSIDKAKFESILMRTKNHSQGWKFYCVLKRFWEIPLVISQYKHC